MGHGQYGGVFDHVDDTLEVADLQVFELSQMADYPDLLQPMTFYVFHRVRQRLAQADRLTVCLMDEAWLPIQHPIFAGEVEEALKTWRKHNAVIILATQAAGDFAKVGLIRPVVENCLTKLFLSNKEFDRGEYADLFHLNAAQIDLLSDLQPKRDVLMVRKEVTKVLQLRVDPKSYWLYTNNSADNARFRAAVATYGSVERALDHLATAH
jgi:type IV secretory pathway VirB4 component